jgi:hypothetical protein
MSWLSNLLRGRLATAEACIREQAPLYRQYHISEVQVVVCQFAGIELTDDEAVEIVQSIRDEYNMGPIADYNMPGFVDEE